MMDQRATAELYRHLHPVIELGAAHRMDHAILDEGSVLARIIFELNWKSDTDQEMRIV